MRIITIAALAALSLSAQAIEYTPDPDVAFDIIQMHDTTTWEKVCQSFDGVCDVPEGIYQVKLLDQNWKELVRLRNVRVHASDQAADLLELFARVAALEAAVGPTYNIGGTGPGGGIVFYLDGSGGGLEAARVDQASNAIWCDPDPNFILNTGTSIGTGLLNTDVSVAACGNNTAAGVARAVGEGWNLPSKDELNQLYLQQDVVGGFAEGGVYWSSSTKPEITLLALFQHFSDGGQVYTFETASGFRVRAVRAF